MSRPLPLSVLLPESPPADADAGSVAAEATTRRTGSRALRARLRGDTAETRIRARGRYFGYPRCCIDAFVRVELPGPEYFLEGMAPWWGTGFIPCAACAAGLPRSGGLDSPGMRSFIDRVIAPARRCALPFPLEPAPAAVDREVIDMLVAESMAEGLPGVP